MLLDSLLFCPPTINFVIDVIPLRENKKSAYSMNVKLQDNLITVFSFESLEALEGIVVTLNAMVVGSNPTLGVLGKAPRPVPRVAM